MKSTHITHSFLVVLVSLFTLTVSTTPAGAQTAPTTSYAFTVNTTADTHDVNPGDGTCADSQGKCSLRAATEEADALPAGSRITITLPKGTYKLKLGALLLRDQRSITINGAGNTATIIKGNHTFRVLYIGSHKMFVHLSQLTIEGGSAPNNRYGGGINNGGTLTVENSTISGNSATGGSGGGIYNVGTLTVENSTLSTNTAGGSGGGIYNVGTLILTHSTVSGNIAIIGNGGIADGGGIDNSGTLTVSTSIFSNNSASYENGGGIDNDNGGTLTVSNSTLSGNTAGNYGGGIDNEGGMLTVSNSTLSGNSAGATGGGIDNYRSMLTVSNSTFSRNWATYGGGGIDNYDGGTLTVSNSTFSRNWGGGGLGGGGISNYAATATVSNSTLSGNSAKSLGGGGISNYAATATVSNSTLSGNSAKSLGGGGISNIGSTVTLTGTIVANSPSGGNCYGPISEGVGYNLDSGSSCGFSRRTDLTNTNPKLGPLRDNGGPTHTMALLQGSKAIDWVAASNCPGTDQRGYMRPDNGESMCDIGAYESAY